MFKVGGKHTDGECLVCIRVCGGRLVPARKPRMRVVSNGSATRGKFGNGPNWVDCQQCRWSDDYEANVGCCKDYVEEVPLPLGSAFF